MIGHWKLAQYFWQHEITPLYYERIENYKLHLLIARGTVLHLVIKKKEIYEWSWLSSDESKSNTKQRAPTSIILRVW